MQETVISTIKSRIYQSIIDNYWNAPSNTTIKDFDENINQISSDFDGEKWPFIQYSDISREGFDNRIHLNNLVKMAVAYKSNASKYFEDKSLLQKIVNGLHFWCKNDFVGENWWNNQIGTPTSLIELMLVIGEELPEGLIVKSQEIINRADINKGGSRPAAIELKYLLSLPKTNFF